MGRGKNLLKRLLLVLVITLPFFFTGCFFLNADAKEVEQYFEEFNEEELEAELEKTFDETLNIISNGDAEKGLAHLQEETIPIAEELVDKYENMELNNEDLKEFNSHIVTLLTGDRDRLYLLEEIFQILIDDISENNLEQLNFFDPLEEIMDINEIMYETFKKMIDKIYVLSEKFDQLELHEDKLEGILDEKEPEIYDELYGLIIIEFLFVLTEYDDDFDALFDAILEAEEKENIEDIIKNYRQSESDADSSNDDIAYDIDIGEFLDKIGSPTVVFDAEASIQDTTLIVEGKSNLVEGTTVVLEGRMYGSQSNVYGLEDKMTVNKNGNFQTEIQFEDGSLSGEQVEQSLHYKPANADEDIQEIHGEKGEFLEGPFVRKYVSSMRTAHGAFTYALIDLKEDETATFTVSELDPPVDYGELDIWMEVDVFEVFDKYYNITLKSNLLALTDVRAEIEVPNYTLAGYNYRGKIGDDGSITFQLPRLNESIENEEDVIFNVTAVFDGVLETIELYGMDGENFEGNLVEESDRGKRIVYEFLLEDVY